MRFITFKSILVISAIFLCGSGHCRTVPDSKEPETELVLVSVIFRHGARSTELFYPTDPNINNDFYPIGLGGLTNEGKLGEFVLGRYLKSMYGEFLGEDYIENRVEVRSTDVTRTKMSAQLVLAGLFPPSTIQQWNPELMWQPIPVSYKSVMEEDLFHPRVNCPYKLDTLDNQHNLSEVQEVFIKPYQEVLEFIQNKSGKVIRHPADVGEMYFILITENEMKLNVPDWTKEIYPEPIRSIARHMYAYYNYDKRVRQINTGYMLKKILEDFQQKIDGSLVPKERKIFMYSGHEATLGYMLDALDLGEPHIPPYGSALSFELRKHGNEYFIKLRYRNDSDATQPVDLTLPGCDTLCPIGKFVELQKELLPTIPVQEACKADPSPEKNQNTVE